MQADVGDIRTPDLIDALNRETSQQIRIAHRLFPWLTQARTRIDRHQTHLPQQPGDPLVVDFMPLRAQPGRHLPDAIERGARVLLIQEPHQQQIVLTFWHRRVIVAGAGQPHELALASQTAAAMLRLNQRPLLFHTAD